MKSLPPAVPPPVDGEGGAPVGAARPSSGASSPVTVMTAAQKSIVLALLFLLFVCLFKNYAGRFTPANSRDITCRAC